MELCCLNLAAADFGQRLCCRDLSEPGLAFGGSLLRAERERGPSDESFRSDL